MDLANKIELLKKHLADGDSVPLSIRKSGLKQSEHTELLKQPEYKALIDFHKKQNKTTSFVDSYIARLSRDKN